MNARLILPYFALICLVATVVVAQGDSSESEEPAASKAPVRHVVLLKFKEDATKTDIKKIEKEFAALKEKIDEVKDLEWGTDSSPEGLAQGFTHCFFLTFDTAADRDAYLPHPAHKAFVSIVKPHLEEALVIDYQPK